MKHWHDWIKDITWTSENHCKQFKFKLRLYKWFTATYHHHSQTDFSDLSPSEMDWHKGKNALWSDVSKVLEITDVVSLQLKRKRIIQIVNCAKFKIQHLWWYGDVLVRMASGVTCTSVMKPLRLKVSYRFGTTCSLSRPCIFQGRLSLFLQDSEVTFCWLTTAWLQNKSAVQ